MSAQRPPLPVALVTGAARGLGSAIADALLADGHRVAILDLDQAASEAAAQRLDPTGERTMGLAADVADVPAAEAAVDAIEARWGAVDVLVNNAGRTVTRSFWEIEPQEWDEVMAVNLRSCVTLTQRCAPAMRAAGWGRIVNMASIAGQRGGAVAGAHYAASKAGMIVVTKIVAGELAGDGITVNAVAPAAVRSPAMDAMDPERVAALERTIPVGRVGTADEVAALVAFLCSDGAAFITGATLDVNGGLLMR